MWLSVYFGHCLSLSFLSKYNAYFNSILHAYTILFFSISYSVIKWFILQTL